MGAKFILKSVYVTEESKNVYVTEAIVGGCLYNGNEYFKEIFI